MPVDSAVHRMYAALVGQGMSKGKAARIAQAKTGLSLKSGRKPKRKKRNGR